MSDGAWSLPFEEQQPSEIPMGDVFLVQGVTVMASVTESALGRLPALVFRFQDAGGWSASLVLVGAPAVIAGTADLVGQAAAAALKAARG